jgi:hypothetical protein
MTINAVYSKHAGKMTKFNYMYVNFSNSVYNLPENHIFNVSITTVQGLKTVSLNVREELIIQSRLQVPFNSKHAGKMNKFNYM